MKRYVDVDKVLETAKEYQKDFAQYILERNVCGLVKIEEILEDTPTADVVEVVRCEDCKHCTYQRSTPYDRYCEQLEINCYGMDFCSCGERKDKE